MASILAIISKAIFEKQPAAIGELWPTAGYASAPRAFDALGASDALFLVTVRPPDERLWLIAVVEAPARHQETWRGKANATRVADITDLITKLRFASGTGITVKPGALAMSLQTPRVLTDDDVALLRGATTTGKGAKRTTAHGGSAPKASATKSVANPASARSSKSAAAPSTKTSATAKSTSGSKRAKPARATDDAAKAVQAAIAAKDGSTALLSALAWWRAEPAPGIAELIDAISARVSGRAVTDEPTWSKLARTRDPHVVGRLLPGVTELAASFLPTAAELLAGFGADPRIAHAVATWALEPPTTSSSTYPFWTKALELVAETGDIRVVPLLKKRLKKEPGTSQFWPKFYAALERVIAGLAGAPRAEVDTSKLVAAAGKLDTLGDLRASGIVAATANAKTKAAAAPKLAGPYLAQAAAHLAAITTTGAWDARAAQPRVIAAIDALVAHWRTSRNAGVADLIDRANRLLPCWDLPLARTQKAVQPAWEAAFSEPAARMPQLLAHLVDGGVKHAELRLVDLANLGDDPRIARRLGELAYGHIVSPVRTQFWKTFWELVARHRDIRVLEPLIREFNGFTSKYYNHHRQAKRILGALIDDPPSAFAGRPELLDAADTALAAKVTEVLAVVEVAARAMEARLLAAIAEAPDDPAPRTVYGDWLLEREHPRGELITTALAGGDVLALREQLPQVFGAFDDLKGVHLDRGLPIRIEARWDTPFLVWPALAAHPLAALVEEIRIDEHTHAPALAELRPLLTTALRLKRLVDAPAEVAAQLSEVDPRWRVDGNHLVRR